MASISTTSSGRTKPATIIGVVVDGVPGDRAPMVIMLNEEKGR